MHTSSMQKRFLRLQRGSVMGSLALTALLLPTVNAAAQPRPSVPRSAEEKQDLDVKWAGMDQSVVPGDDFFSYANGAWLKTTPIPPDKPGWGTFYELMEEASRDTRALLEEAQAKGGPSGSELRKIGDYYAAFMDEAAIEAKGVSALAPLLTRLAKITDRATLSRVLGEELRADVDPLNTTSFHTSRLFGLWVAPNFNASKEYAPYLLQGGLGLPDREYYLATSTQMAALREKYQAHLAQVFRLVGFSDAAARAARVFALETRMAQQHASRESSEDVRKANNPWKRSEFANRAPGIDWEAFFRGAGLTQVATFIVWHPEAVRGLSALTKSEPLDVWRDWLVAHAIDRRSSTLPKAFVEESFAFYEKTLAGTLTIPERWKRGVAAVNAALGDAVGKLYVERTFPPSYKAQVQDMVKNIRAAFAGRIDKLEWMSAITKARAKEKLGTLYVGVGYPERWVDYSALEVLRGDALGNAERAELCEYRRVVAKLGRAVDVSEWAMTPQTVNALNLPLQNALNFPAAVLRPPFFDPQATSAENYGAIGSIIGHEISHSFDDQGAQFDASGKLANWWTEEDRQHLEASAAKLAAQFDAYKPLPDLHVNGKLTLSENIADLAGLSATYDAWKQSLGGQSAATAKGFSGEQLFFLAYGRAWRAKSREPALRQQLITDPHAPEKYRGETVRNLDAWYPAFDVRPGQQLFLPPKDRVRVW